MHLVASRSPRQWLKLGGHALPLVLAVLIGGCADRKLAPLIDSPDVLRQRLIAERPKALDDLNLRVRDAAADGTGLCDRGQVPILRRPTSVASTAACEPGDASDDLADNWRQRQLTVGLGHLLFSPPIVRERFLRQLAHTIPTTAQSAVGALLSGESLETAVLVCSGALVAPDKFLTAQHCVDVDHTPTAGKHEREFKYWVYLPLTGIHPASFPDIEKCCVTRGDVVIASLDRPAVGVPLLPMSRERPRDGTPGAIYGYGITHPDLFDRGVKRRTNILIRDCSPAVDTPVPKLCFRAGDGAVGDAEVGHCFNDSGGPLLARIDGVLKIVGVASDANLLCTEGSFADVALDFDQLATMAQSSVPVGEPRVVLNPNDRFGEITTASDADTVSISSPDAKDVRISLNFAETAATPFTMTRNNFALSATIANCRRVDYKLETCMGNGPVDTLSAEVNATGRIDVPDEDINLVEGGFGVYQLTMSKAGD